MKLTDNKTKSVTIRVSPKEFEYLQAVAYMSGMTVSKYVRTIIDSTVNAAKLQERAGRLNLEDFKAVLDDQL